jgi:Flp pilus assembly protein TadG
MKPAAATRQFRLLLHRFVGDRAGMSAVEFAIILPFMLLLYLGGVEFSDGFAIKYKVTETSRTVTDLASQYVSIDGATMQNLLKASAQIVAPYSATNLVVTLSQVSPTNSSGQGTIAWSCSLNGTAHTVGASVTLPTKLQTPSGVSIIWGEVSYPYTPSTAYVVTGTINLYQTFYFYPRLSNSVTVSSCS